MDFEKAKITAEVWTLKLKTKFLLLIGLLGFALIGLGAFRAWEKYQEVKLALLIAPQGGIFETMIIPEILLITVGCVLIYSISSSSV